MSKVYSFKRVQQIPVDINTAWNFFSMADNLDKITPASLGFKIISANSSSLHIFAGQLIEYRVKPLFGIAVYWMTEITHVKEKEYFIDEQKVGPYILWNHQHHFKPIANGVEMIDIVHYKIPFWFIGDVANGLIVTKKLKKIFDFRFKVIEEMFGVY